MKIFITLLSIISSLAFFSGCSHQRSEKSQTIANKKLEDFQPIPLIEIEQKAYDLINNHEEFSKTQREELNKVVHHYFFQLQKLKDEESKIQQALLEDFFIKDASSAEIKALRNALDKSYKNKSELLFDSVSRMKKVLGISPQNSSIMNDILWSIQGR